MKLYPPPRIWLSPPVWIGLLWLVLAALVALELLLPQNYSLLGFYFLPPLVAATFFPPRQVIWFAVAALAAAIVSGWHLDLFLSTPYLVHLAASTAIGASAVLLAAARERQAAATGWEKARLRATLDSLLDPHILLTAIRSDNGQIVDFVFEDANEAACTYNKLPRENMVGSRLLQILPSHKATGLFRIYCDVIEKGHLLALDDYLYPHDILEKPRFYDIRAAKIGDSLSFTWRDVTERHSDTEILQHKARTDELTNLLNRRGALEQLETLRGKTARTGRDIAVLFVDFDRFKSINDIYGHAAGDDVLRTTAERLRACLRSSDDLGARVGGDELMVVLNGVHGIRDAVSVADKLRRLAAEPIRHNGYSIEATVSIGVALAHEEESTESLVARADASMYEAKQHGRNQVITVEEAIAA